MSDLLNARRNHLAMIRGYADRVVRDVYQINPRVDGLLYDDAIDDIEPSLALAWHEGMAWEEIEQLASPNVERWQMTMRARQKAFLKRALERY